MRRKLEETWRPSLLRYAVQLAHSSIFHNRSNYVTQVVFAGGDLTCISATQGSGPG